MGTTENKKKGLILPEMKATIAKYAIENGNYAASRKFGHSLEKKLNESTVRSWVSLYRRELERKRKSDEVPEVKILPEAKRG